MSVSTRFAPCLRWQRCQLVKVGSCIPPLLGGALGLPRMALSDGLVFVRVSFRLFSRTSGVEIGRGVLGRTLSRVVARQLVGY